MLAWRLLHEPRLAELPRWLSALVPRGGPFDRDPLALLLGSCCAAIAVALLAAGLAGGGIRLRAALLSAGAVLAVVLPSVALMAMGWAIDRPYGQDGGIVQLPLAIEHLLQGRSPYGADYSNSMLGRQARVSPFWQAYGGNPLLRHHAYLPGTHLLMLPGYLACRMAGLVFDARVVTLLAFAAAALLALRLVGRARPERALAAAAVVLVNPLVYWPQAFGANDMVQVALLLLAVLLAEGGRPVWSGAVLGLACASKQLAWPFAPFLLAHLSGAASLRELLAPRAWRRMAGPAAAALGVFVMVVVPVAALDARAFWRDIVVYNAGLPASDSYPLGGTPGFGFANFLIYFGRVASLGEHVSFTPFYVLLLPLGVLLLRAQLARREPSSVLVAGSVALLASVYFSRVVHPNYLLPVAVLLPIGLLAAGRVREARTDVGATAARWPPDVAVVPLALLLLAVELVEHEVFRAVWEDAVGARWASRVAAPLRLLLPRAGPSLSADPLGYLLASVAAGMALAWLALGVLGARPRWRLGLGAVSMVALLVVPALVVADIGVAVGSPRAQDAWLAPVSITARRSLGISDPAPVREAWSQSFRRDPPSILEGGGAPPQRALGRLLAVLGEADLRLWLAVAMAAAAVVAVVLSRPSRQPLALGALALAPPAVVGAIFGSEDVLAAALVLTAWWLSRERPVLAAAILGAACALVPRLLWLMPLLVPGRREPAAGVSVWAAAAASFGTMLGVTFAAGGAAWALPRLQPALGLPNLLLYSGVTAWPPTLSLFLLVVPLLIALAASRPFAPLPAAALTALVGLWLSPVGSPHDLVLPLGLLVLTPPSEERM